MKRKTHMHVRPLEVDAGRGPELARIPMPQGGGRRGPGKTVRTLHPDGEQVDATGNVGRYWRSRIAEGSAEEFTPARAPTKPKAED